MDDHHHLDMVNNVLLKVNHRLAAVHAVRARRIDSTTHCTKCGSFLLNGDGEIRIGRKDRRRRYHPSATRVLQKKCRSCGHCQEVTFSRGDVKGDSPSPTRPQPQQPVAVAVTQKKRPKKTGLQDMLSRNREKEQGRLQAKKVQESSGLAAFLTSIE
jgi:hypothetical protein